MSSALEPAIWSCDSGQRMCCFDSCQLTMIWPLTKANVQARSIIWWTGKQRTPCCPTPYVRSRHAPASKCRLPGWPWKTRCMGFLFLCMVFFGLSNFYRYGASGRRSSAIIVMWCWSRTLRVSHWSIFFTSSYHTYIFAVSWEKSSVKDRRPTIFISVRIMYLLKIKSQQPLKINSQLKLVTCCLP